MTLELRGSARPTLQQALRWIGSRVDDIYGASIGKLEDIWMDPDSGEPLWLLVRDGRIGGRHTLVPFAQAASGAGHVWIPFEREVVRGAPAVRPSAPLSHELSDTLRRYYAESGHPVAENRTRAEETLRPTPAEPAVAAAAQAGTMRAEPPRVTAHSTPAATSPRRPAPPPESPAPRYADRRPGWSAEQPPPAEPPPLPPMPRAAPRRPQHQPQPPRDEGFVAPRPQEPWARADTPAPPPPIPAPPTAPLRVENALRLRVGDSVDMELVGRLQFRGNVVRMEPLRPGADARG